MTNVQRLESLAADLATAQTIADLTGSDPRTVAKRVQPVAILHTPNGERPLYAFTKRERVEALAKSLGEAQAADQTK